VRVCRSAAQITAALTSLGRLPLRAASSFATIFRAQLGWNPLVAEERVDLFLGRETACTSPLSRLSVTAVLGHRKAPRRTASLAQRDVVLPFEPVKCWSRLPKDSGGDDAAGRTATRPERRRSPWWRPRGRHTLHEPRGAGGRTRRAAGPAVRRCRDQIEDRERFPGTDAREPGDRHLERGRMCGELSCVSTQLRPARCRGESGVGPPFGARGLPQAGEDLLLRLRSESGEPRAAACASGLRTRRRVDRRDPEARDHRRRAVFWSKAG